ncbi:MAG: helix-turn-helix transcriptional regulator [Opitutaceae bacterium]|nr:helix-turn-helix transcriptional regulator [Opitutaceae bacterium]
MAHLTQAQLARGGGLSPSEVQHIERGRRHPKTETQRRLCAALGITLLELMAEVDRVQREWERQGR